MKIYIDVSVLTLATFVTGIQRVTREIAVRLIEDKDNDIFLLHYNAKENCYYRIDNRLFCQYYREGKGIKNKMITKEKVDYAEIGEGCIFFDLDAAWMSRVKRSWLLPILKEQGAKIIAHIYDIISVTHPQYCLERGVYNFMDYIGAHLQYADKIIVNAQATVDELQKLTERIQIKLPPCFVIPLGADFKNNEIVEQCQVTKQLVDIVNSGPYILMVGTIEPRKNHKLLLEAYDKGLKQMGYHIIMAGYMGWNMEDFSDSLYHHADFGKGIFHFEGLDDTSIAFLYQNAKFLAFCSYTEGFGLPIIESIMRGTPVLSADVPVLNEVGKDYCIWFEQDNVEAFVQVIRKYLRDSLEYERLVRRLTTYRCHDWKQTFEKVLDALT